MSYTKEETILEVENVSLSYGKKKILEGVNAKIDNIVRPNMTQGQIVGLLGPSGLGKTKLFEILAGILRNDPSNGVNVGGQVLLHGKPVDIGSVGVVQQNYPLFNHRTVHANLMIAARLHQSDKSASARVDEFLSILEMEEHGSKFPMQLSGGQRQRVAIAQQLLCNKDVLLMDEPFSGLDVLMIKKVSDLIIRGANMKETNTIVIVSHDVTSTASISDTIWLLGRMKDADNKPASGAFIKHIYDLAAAGLAWRENIGTDKVFLETCLDIKSKFTTL